MATVGIDLGTTNTLVCINQKGKEKCLRFGAMDSEILPSCIYVDEDEEIIVGEEARDEGILDPENFVSSAKTYMGTDKIYSCNGLEFNPTKVATEILKVVREKVIETLDLEDDEMVDAVITVPAYFSSKQRGETKKAGIEAGLNVTKIIAEPTAAAVAFIDDTEAEDKVFVVDFGGGTFDLCVLEQDNDENYRTCYAPGGDRTLGGDNIDELIIDGVIEWYKEKYDIDLSSYEKSGTADKSEYLSARAKIKREVEKAKIKLSKKSEADISIPNFARINGKYEDFDITLTRERMEEWCKPVFDRVEKLIVDYIDEIKTAGIDMDSVEHIVLVGGSCYIPKIKEIVEGIFGKKTNTSMDLSTMVAKGACIVANSLNGVEDGPRFIDVIAHSLGLEVKGEKFEKMLNRGTRICKGDKYSVTRIFTTTYDNQESIDVNVYETADDDDETDINKLTPYGKFVMDNITKAKKGEASIEIMFEYDDNGCLVVTSTDLQSGLSKEVEMHGEIWDESDIASGNASIDFALLIDTSGSMNGSPLESAKRASRKLINEMVDLTCHRLGIVTFNSEADIVTGLSNSIDELISKINSIKNANGATVLAEAMAKGQELLKNSSNEKVIVAVTDGAPMVNNIDREISILKRILGYNNFSNRNNYDKICVDTAKAIKNAGTRVIIIGVGVGDNAKKLMAEIASNNNGKSDFYSIDNMNQLADTFATVMRDIVVKGV